MKYFFAFLFSALCVPALADMLPYTGVTEHNVQVTVLNDNAPGTFITVTNGDGFYIDLSGTRNISRVYLIGTLTNLPIWGLTYREAHVGASPFATINIWYGAATNACTNLITAWTTPYDGTNATGHADTELDVHFSPVSGRFLKFEQAGVSWDVGEVEIYGSPNSATNAIVLGSTSNVLAVAASDLSYYLGELYHSPVPVITNSTQTNLYSGTIYWVDDQKPLAPDYATQQANFANGSLRYIVGMTKEGRDIRFTSFPYINEVWSIWEFLQRQGVRWVYPTGQGDYVPSGVTVDTTPFTNNIPTSNRGATWDVGAFQPWRYSVSQSLRQGILWPWRNFNTGGFDPTFFNYAELCSAPTSGSLNANYSEGFTLYPHTFANLVPERVILTNFTWWGSLDNGVTSNSSPSTVAFNMASPTLAGWVAAKVLAWDAYSPQQYFMMPMDAVPFDTGTNSQAANTLYGGTYTGTPWVDPFPYSSGGAYYKLLSTVANITTNQTIYGLAYTSVFDPPASNYPPNVSMQVTLWGSPNLPFTATPNAAMLNALQLWNLRTSSLSSYDYQLLFVDGLTYNYSTLIVPLVTAGVQRAMYLASIGALDGIVQAEPQIVQYNPWDFYYYPRIRWNTNQTAGTLLSEFFAAYFKESRVGMFNYYVSPESYQQATEVNLHKVGYAYGATPGSFPVNVLQSMNTNLAAAKAVATNWVTKSRLADMQFQLNNLLATNNLTLANLTNFSGFQVVAFTNSPVIYSGATPLGLLFTNCIPATASFSVDKINLYGSCNASVQLNLIDYARYRVTVHAKKTAFAVGTPTLTIFLGPHNSETFSISSTSYTDYVFEDIYAPSIQEFTMAYTGSGGGNEHTSIDRVTVEAIDLPWMGWISQDGEPHGGTNSIAWFNGAPVTFTNVYFTGDFTTAAELNESGTPSDNIILDMTRARWIAGIWPTGAFRSPGHGDFQVIGGLFAATNNGSGRGFTNNCLGMDLVNTFRAVFNGCTVTGMFSRLPGSREFSPTTLGADTVAMKFTLYQADITVSNCFLSGAEVLMNFKDWGIAQINSNFHIRSNVLFNSCISISFASAFTPSDPRHFRDFYVENNVFDHQRPWSAPPENSSWNLHLNYIFPFMADNAGNFNAYGTTISNIVISGNYFGPDVAGTNFNTSLAIQTQWGVTNFTVDGIRVFNNVFRWTNTICHSLWNNGFITITGDTNLFIVNNDFIVDAAVDCDTGLLSGRNTVNTMEGYPVWFANNFTLNCHLQNYFNGGGVQTNFVKGTWSDYNVFALPWTSYTFGNLGQYDFFGPEPGFPINGVGLGWEDWTNKLFTVGVATARFDRHSTTNNPLYNADFSPPTNSILVDAGTNLTAYGITSDYNGSNRPAIGMWSIGAFEVGTAGGGGGGGGGIVATNAIKPRARM